MTSSDKPFLTDIEELRRRAREDMDRGAVTSAYGLDINQAIDLLNKVLASEIVCVLRYKRHYYMATGINAEPVAQEFLQHANDEQLHADQVAMRITQLGGAPDFDPEGLLTRSVAEYKPGDSLVDMIKEDLLAERVVIMWYSEIVNWFGDRDSTTRRLLRTCWPRKRSTRTTWPASLRSSTANCDFLPFDVWCIHHEAQADLR